MTTRVETIIPAAMKAGYEAFQFAPATRVGDLLFLSGQLGLSPDGTAIEDLEAQFTAAFESVTALTSPAEPMDIRRSPGGIDR